MVRRIWEMTLLALLVSGLGACVMPGGGGGASRDKSAGGESEPKGGGLLSDVARQVEKAAGVATEAPVVLPAGTRVTVTIGTTLGSDVSHVGDEVVGKVAHPIVLGDRVVVPEGSEVRGTVTAAVISGKIKGRGELAFHLSRVVVKGREYEVPFSAIEVRAKSGKGNDAKMIGGGAAAGAVVGALAGGRKGALIGAGVGAGAGTGASLATRGPQARVAAGAQFTVKTTREVSLSL